jgi:hypothetical protein
VAEYVNADLFAQGLSAFDTEAVAFQAGRVMLARLKQLAAQKRTFALETTLATRSYLPWLSSLQEGGYAVDLVFLWLPAPEMAVARVMERVGPGGHDVPETVSAADTAAGWRTSFARIGRERTGGGSSTTRGRKGRASSAAGRETAQAMSAAARHGRTCWRSSDDTAAAGPGTGIGGQG